MLVLVPPTILHPMQTVFHLPMLANQAEKFLRCDLTWIKAANKEPRIVRLLRAIGTKNLSIHTHKNLTARDIQLLTDILGIINVAPDFADFNVEGFTVQSQGEHVIYRASKWYGQKSL